MSKFHTRYKNIHKKVLRAATDMFEQGAWSGTDEDIHARFQTWANTAADAYGIPHPEVMLTTAETDTTGAYLPSCGTIVLRSWSVTILFHEFRHHMQEHGVAPRMSPQAEEYDAHAWACSLYYCARPGAFCRAVAAGKIPGVHPSDLGAPRAPDRPTAPLTAEEERVAEAIVDGLLEQLDADDPLAVLLDELNGDPH